MAHKDLVLTASYNDRLFSTGLRGWFHTARFRWLQQKCIEFQPDLSAVVEVGCFDARSIDYFPTTPLEYFGYDAGWENGLDAAITKYQDNKNYVFKKCLAADQLTFPPKKNASLVVSLETLEHIPPHLLPAYFDKLRDISSGYFFVSVPNEKGLVFLIKWLFKALLCPSKATYTYSFKEVIFATFGKLTKVQRNEHKGFDWEVLRNQIGNYFDLVKVEGVQFPWLPASLNVQIGMIFKARP